MDLFMLPCFKGKQMKKQKKNKKKQKKPEEKRIREKWKRKFFEDGGAKGFCMGIFELTIQPSERIHHIG